MDKDKNKKKKTRKITAQCIGIVLICFALGMFVGNAYNYRDFFANIVSDGVNKVHVIHSSSEMTERGARIVLYTLGTEENNNYDINFESKVSQDKNKIYNIKGSFTNTSDKHFTTIELNFSLLDKDGNKIGDAFAYCEGLNPEQTWKFSAINNKIINTDKETLSVILDDIIVTTL